jgi:hypothetical protein
LSDFVAQLYLSAAFKPCILCNTIHLLTIHSYPERLFRDPETGLNRQMSVVCVSCEVSSAQGGQYTKRCLPDFLVRGCVIRLDATLSAIEAGTGTPALVEAACVLMGCTDDRTVKRHVALASASVRLASLRMSEIIAENPETAIKPDISPDTDTGETFRRLLAAMVLGLARKGHRGWTPTELGLVHDFWRREGTPKPLTCVCRNRSLSGKSIEHGGQSP